MSDNFGGISQSVNGGNVYGGIQAAQGNNNQQTQETNMAAPSADKQLSQAEAIDLMVQLEQLFGSAELPEATKEKLLRYLGAAREEIQEKEPNKQLAAGNLKRMSETLETTSKTVESAKSLWENTKPVLMQLPSWLGVAKTFFGL